MSATTDSGGEVAISIGNQTISGWETVQITRSIETCPNHFSLTMTEPYPDDPTRILVEPGHPCQIYIGGNLVITGFVDRYSSQISPGSHAVEITGRGNCQDLVDCSADLLSPDSPVVGGSVQASSLLDLAKKLTRPFGIDAICRGADPGWPIPVFQVALGDTPFQVIERVARYAGFLLYEEEHGDLVLDRVGTQPMASGFAQGVNVEAAASSLDFHQRYSRITLLYSTIDQVQEGAEANLYNRKAEVTDPALEALGRFRPRIGVSAQTDGSPDYAQRQANWELARRIGRSQAVQITCDSWRDSAGQLWQPNWLAPVDLRALKLKAQWIIATVTFRKDPSGTHADLQLMPPDAFSIEPSVLAPFDREFYQNPDRANPGPATTSPGAH